MRYGGAYLDMTTVMFRSLDGIWDNDGDGVDNRLYVTSVLELDDSNNHEYYPRPAMTNSNLHDEHDTLPSSTLSNRKCREGAAPNPALLNNAVLLSPRPNNPILVEFLHRSLQYSENPANSLSEIQSRPEFSRVLPHILSDKNLGLLGSESMVLYMAYLWIFTDLVMYDEILRAGELVVDLPTLRWTYDFLVLPSLMKEGASPSSLWLLVSGLFSRWCTYWKRLFLSQDYDALASSSQSYPLSSLTSQLQYERRQQQKHLRVYDWKIWNTAIRTLQMLRYAAYDEQSLASAMVEDITMIKSSSDNTNKYQSQMKTYQELVGQETTMGRMYRAAVQGTGRNATLDGARPLGYGAPRDW